MGWRTLRDLGFTIKLDDNFKPKTVYLAKFGIDVEIIEKNGTEVQVARKLGDAIDVSILGKEVESETVTNPDDNKGTAIPGPCGREAGNFSEIPDEAKVLTSFRRATSQQKRQHLRKLK